jgi:MerR family transcriptional regulator, copper efflux regulator
MRITQAAQRLGTSPRMLRYRDLLGLLPPVRETTPAAGRTPRETTPAAGRTPRETTPAAGRTPRETTPATGRAPSGHPRGHRRFSDDDLAAVAHALWIEQRYDISPAALAFGLKVLTEPGVRADVAELGRRLRRIAPPPARALDFEQERARRLLRLPAGRGPGGTAPGASPSGIRGR